MKGGKICTKCFTVRPLKDFHVRRTRTNRRARHEHCKYCRREYMRDWYASLTPDQREKRRARAKLAMREYRARVHSPEKARKTALKLPNKRLSPKAVHMKHA